MASFPASTDQIHFPFLLLLNPSKDFKKFASATSSMTSVRRCRKLQAINKF